MSFLFRNSNKQFTGNIQKIIDENKNRYFKKKLITNKKYSDIDLSKIYSNLKDYYAFSPKFNTFKNSRNQIFLIIYIYII